MLLQKIKYLCEKQGISVAKLEQTLGFSNGTISGWDIKSPLAKNLAKVAEFFHVNIDYLLGTPGALSEDAVEVARSFDGLTQRQKGLVRLYISVISKEDRGEKG